uniref:B1549_C1_186 n=1 Tax=Mycobacterium leprae TaxID=1769 RepID=Q49708_MYCLR|nr:B1549_C1_186 [Mycobacterium leprae]
MCNRQRRDLRMVCVNMNGPGLPLIGVSVVRVSIFVFAPLCAAMFSQLGAVIRVNLISDASDVHRWPMATDGTSIYCPDQEKAFGHDRSAFDRRVTARPAAGRRGGRHRRHQRR